MVLTLSRDHLTFHCMDYQAELFDRMQLLFAETGFNDHMLHCEMRMDSRIDERKLHRATELALSSFPILATRFSERPTGAVWESIAGAKLERAFATAEDEKGFEAERTFRIREEEGPQLRVGLLHGERSALAVTINHMITDGAGLKDFIYFLCETYNRLRAEPQYRAPLLDGYRGILDVTRGFGTWAKLRALLGRGGRNNRPGGVAFPLKEGGEKRPFIATRTIGREKTGELKAYCAARGATLNDAALAAYYRALFRSIGASARGRLEVPVMIDMRRYLPSRELSALRNLSSTATTRLVVRECESFEESLLKAKAKMDELKGRAIGLGGFVKISMLSALGSKARTEKLLRRGLRNPLVCMTNIGELDSKKLRLDGSRVVSAYACGSIKYKPHFQMALSSFDGMITLSSNLYGGEDDERRVEAFLAEVELELSSRGA
jgi:NRPS condensation-like uncharacterized protein